MINFEFTVPDPPSMDISSVSNMAHIRQEHESAKERENEMKIGKEKDENETAGNEVRRVVMHWEVWAEIQ